MILCVGVPRECILLHFLRFVVSDVIEITVNQTKWRNDVAKNSELRTQNFIFYNDNIQWDVDFRGTPTKA